MISKKNRRVMRRFEGNVARCRLLLLDGAVGFQVAGAA